MTRRTRHALLCAALLPTLLASHPLHATTEPIPQDIARLAERFLGEQLAAPGRQIEVAIHSTGAQLPLCNDPQAFLPQPLQPRPSRLVVGIRCSDSSQRYLQANVTIRASYPVSRRALGKDEILSADMIEIRTGDIGKLPRNTVLEADEAIGRQLTRPLAAGSLLTDNALRNPPAVARGATVRVEARSNGFVASREGVALDGGGVGDTIRVKTTGGGVIHARISGPNLLEVDF